MAIQGQYYHPGGADNATVLQNPTAVPIGNNFLAHGALNNLVTEPHFAERAPAAPDIVHGEHAV
ncbi:hypothetical protein LP419_12105 [Massilia sp. H-1]|nr:hypothetical protein LP419_12105 [Massilia sp. H-1]